MTNEEKALVLAEDNKRVYKDSEYDYTFYAIRDGCVEMAQWKDEQTKIAIEKAKAEAQLEILNWMKDEVATYHTKEQVMRKIRYLKSKLKKLNNKNL